MEKRICILAVFCAVLLAAGCAGDGKTAAESEPVSFVIATDLHYISPALTANSPFFLQLVSESDGKVTHYAEEVTDAFLAEVQAQKPDLLILSGDLTMNGAVESHRALIEKLNAVQAAGIQVLVIPGNHDVDSNYAAKFLGDTAEKAEALTSEAFFDCYEKFGRAQALSRDEHSFSYIFQAGEGLRIVMLDTNCYGQCFVKDETLAWLEAELKQVREAGDAVIAVTHQNLYAHNALLSFGYQLYNAKELQALFETYGVKCNFSGHIHMQSILEGDVTEIATSSLLVSPLQYGKVNVHGGVLEYSLQETDVAAWAKAAGSADETLLQFGDYAEEFFETTARNQVFSAFAESGLREAEKELLAETFAKINAAYFAGAPIDPAEHEAGLALWEEQEGSFFLSYINSMLEAGKTRRQEAVIPLG